MPRLIDAEELIENIDERLEVIDMQIRTSPTKETKEHWMGKYAGTNYVRNKILEAPTVDAVEVVRCRDCEKYDADVITDGVGWCNANDCGACADGYCEQGKRKDGE